MDKEYLLQETMIQLTADIYNQVYDYCDGYDEATEKIISLAKEFEKELDRKENDERDFIFELEKFEDKVLKSLDGKKKTIYNKYEEIKQREIRELKDKLKRFGCVAHFGPDYTDDGATGKDFPFILCNLDYGPVDIKVMAVRLKDNELSILGYDTDAGQYINIDLEDIAYSHISFITEAIPDVV